MFIFCCSKCMQLVAQSNLTKDCTAAAYGLDGIAYTLQLAAPPSSKFPLPMGDLDAYLIHGFLGPPMSTDPKGVSIGSAIFAGLTGSRWWQTDTDRQTDSATPSVTWGRIYVHSTVMRPNNTHTANLLVPWSWKNVKICQHLAMLWPRVRLHTFLIYCVVFRHWLKLGRVKTTCYYS